MGYRDIEEIEGETYRGGKERGQEREREKMGERLGKRERERERRWDTEI